MAFSVPNEPRRFRKGERIFSSGTSSDRVFLLQSGLVSLMAQGDLEVGQASAPQIIGEEALWGAPTRTVSALALNDTEALELSVPQAQALIDAYPALLKLLVKNLLKKQKAISCEVVASKLGDATTVPCPLEVIPRLFAILYHAAVSTGKKSASGEVLTVVWPAYRKYCHWGFLESPTRLEQATELLSKLGFADLEMVASETDPEAPPELGYVHFKKIELLQTFYRFCHTQQAVGLESAMMTASTSGEVHGREHYLLLREIQAWNKHGKVEH